MCKILKFRAPKILAKMKPPEDAFFFYKVIPLTRCFSLKFEELILNNPKVGLQVIRNLSERVSWLTSRIGSLAVTNIEERLYRVLKSVAKEHGTIDSRGIVIQFPLTHEDLGFLTGAHRVSITRAMKSLKEAGKILHEDRRLILLPSQTT